MRNKPCGNLKCSITEKDECDVKFVKFKCPTCNKEFSVEEKDTKDMFGCYDCVDCFSKKFNNENC